MDRILCLLIYMISAFSGSAKILPGPYEKWEPGKRLKILLVGYNGARNTGSDVRVAAIAKQVKALFGEEQVQITVMTLDAGNLAGQYDKWYFFSDSPGRREACRRYIRGFAAGTRAFLKKQDYFPVLIGMEKLDAEACRALQARLSCPGAVFLSGIWPAS